MKQFRSTGFWKCGIEEFRNLLDIPEKYRITDIDAWVLKPIQKELGEKYNLKIEKKYGFSGGRGRSRVTGFEFKFSTEKKVDIVAGNEEEDNPIPLSKPRKQKKKEETRVVSERKTRIVEAPPKIEKEKTLREKIWDKILPGQIDRFIADNTQIDQRLTLLGQFYVMDDKKTVEQVIEEEAKKLGGKIEIVKYIRFEVGEGLEKKSEDFAAEVAAQIG